MLFLVLPPCAELKQGRMKAYWLPSCNLGLKLSGMAPSLISLLGAPRLFRGVTWCQSNSRPSEPVHALVMLLLLLLLPPLLLPLLPLPSSVIASAFLYPCYPLPLPSSVPAPAALHGTVTLFPSWSSKTPPRRNPVPNSLSSYSCSSYHFSYCSGSYCPYYCFSSSPPPSLIVLLLMVLLLLPSSAPASVLDGTVTLFPSWSSKTPPRRNPVPK
eukprot:gene20040-26755_t